MMGASTGAGAGSAAPLYAIVISAYNEEKTLGRAIDSVLAQSLPDWRLVVVDDGSTDGTAAVALRYAARDARVEVVVQENLGVGKGLNNGVARSDTEFVGFLGADDELDPRYLDAMDAFIGRHPGFDIYHPNLTVVAEDGTVSPFCARPDVCSFGFEDLLDKCVIAAGGTIVTRTCFDELGGFRPMVRAQDYDLWLRATARGARALYLPEELYVYHLDRALPRNDDGREGAMAVIGSLDDLLKQGMVPSAMVSRTEEAIARRRRRLLGDADDRALARQAVWLQSTLERWLGEPSAGAVLSHLRSVTTAARPIRRSIARTLASRALDAKLERHQDRVSRRTLAPDRSSLDGALKVLVIPSWYPSLEQPTAGIFIQQQVEALQERAGIAVVYVHEAVEGLRPRAAAEGGARVVRAQLKMPPVSRTIPGRARAVATNLFNKLFCYPRTGLAAFEILRGTWGAPDIVHVQALWPAGLIACAIKRRYGIPYVVTEHSEEYLAASERRLVRTPGVVRFLLRPLARGASRTIVVSRFLAERLTQLGLAVDPVVIPNVVSSTTPALLPVAERQAIAHVSIMGPAKDLGALLRAVDRLGRRRTDFVLRLIGDGESRPELQRMAAALKLDDVVEFVGRVPSDEVRVLLAGSAFSVVSSTHETFSVAAAESLMCGRPVLSTRCGGPEEFITPDVGRLIPARSVDALVEGLDWMLDHFREFDPEALHRYAAERFAPEVVAEQILAVYRSVLDGR